MCCQVLNGLDVEVMAGEKVALVGTSGSGKSTVIKLIQRLYDASSGEVGQSSNITQRILAAFVLRELCYNTCSIADLCLLCL